ncbi:hypothetical protein TNCV_2224871 [Trichonephila clavipes]|nr:hypothetical protein TNCV_2224871 [Trichonephila clavipes]
MRSTKELIKKDVLMPVKHNVFLWNLPDVEEMPSHDGETILLWYPWKGKKEYVPLRTAYSQDSRYGMQPKARQSSRAGAAKTRTKTFELVEEKQKLLDIRERRENARVVKTKSCRLDIPIRCPTIITWEIDECFNPY